MKAERSNLVPTQITILASIDVEVIEIEDKKILFRRSVEEGKYVLRQISEQDIRLDERIVYHGSATTVSGKSHKDTFWVKLRETDICAGDMFVRFVPGAADQIFQDRYIPLMDERKFSEAFRENVLVS